MKPIKFRADLIPLIESGSKTQTRRPVKSETCKYQPGDLLHVVSMGKRGGCKKTDLFLRVTSIREEDLSDITTTSAMDEGFSICEDKFLPAFLRECAPSDFPILKFCNFWEVCYPDPPYRREDNPRVWVIDFEVEEANNDV